MTNHANDRFPPIAPEDLTSEQREIHDGIMKILPGGNTSFKYKEDNGALIGPLPFVMFTPSIARAFQAGLQAVSGYGKTANPPLSPECREIAILGVGAKKRAGFMLYSHDFVSQSETNFSSQQIKDLMRGIRPDGLDDKCNIAFDVVQHLTSVPGDLPNQLYQSAVKLLGKEAAIALIHYAGYYQFVATVLNAGAIPVPEEYDGLKGI